MASHSVSKMLLKNSSALLFMQREDAEDFSRDHFLPAIDALYEAPQPNPAKPVKGSSEMKTAEVTKLPEARPARAKKEFCTTTEVVAIVTSLNSNCAKGEDGMAKYAAGMNDERIVDEVVLPMLANGKPHDPARRRIILHRLKSIRFQVYGGVKIASKGPGSPSKEARIAKLENRIAMLEADVAELISALGFKRVQK